MTTQELCRAGHDHSQPPLAGMPATGRIEAHRVQHRRSHVAPPAKSNEHSAAHIAVEIVRVAHDPRGMDRRAILRLSRTRRPALAAGGRLNLASARGLELGASRGSVVGVELALLSFELIGTVEREAAPEALAIRPAATHRRFDDLGGRAPGNRRSYRLSQRCGQGRRPSARPISPC
jgi:hypothetical protein